LASDAGFEANGSGETLGTNPLSAAAILLLLVT
jgi:hypothetical protein